MIDRIQCPGLSGAVYLTCAGRASNQTDGFIASDELDIFSLGLTWWLTALLHINANDRYIESEQGGVNGNSSAVMTRFLLLLE